MEAEWNVFKRRRTTAPRIERKKEYELGFTNTKPYEWLFTDVIQPGPYPVVMKCKYERINGGEWRLVDRRIKKPFARLERDWSDTDFPPFNE